MASALQVVLLFGIAAGVTAGLIYVFTSKGLYREEPVYREIRPVLENEESIEYEAYDGTMRKIHAHRTIVHRSLS